MEKPILFNTAMVQAILKSKKSSTRRPFKKPFEVHPNGMITKQRGNERLVPYEPPYHVGDIIYVRETWLKGDDGLHYKADETPISKEAREAYGYKWKPSIHMPKVVARLFLKVTDVMAERIQDITEDGSIKEGFDNVLPVFTAKELFQAEWNSIYKNWDENPWVWVIEFERIGGIKMTDLEKLDLINTMEFIEDDADGECCNSVSVRDNEVNRSILHKIGFDDEFIAFEGLAEEESEDCEFKVINVTPIAFKYCNWWFGDYFGNNDDE